MSAIEEMLETLLEEGYRLTLRKPTSRDDEGSYRYYEVDVYVGANILPVAASSADTLREALSEAYQSTPAIVADGDED